MVDFTFEVFPKIPRLKREVVITEKIDGTNAQIAWIPLDTEEKYAYALQDSDVIKIVPGNENGDHALALKVGSRQRWIYPLKQRDNYGFAAWVLEHSEELLSLGEGRHYGEWYGQGIQRGYDIPEKRFALFNPIRWNDENPNRPACCGVVPVLARGEDVNDDLVMRGLDAHGSYVVEGYKRPEGIVVFHSASRQMYKRTFDGDGGKWRPEVVQ